MGTSAPSVKEYRIDTLINTRSYTECMCPSFAQAREARRAHLGFKCATASCFTALLPIVFRFDFTCANINEDNFEKLKQADIPDVVRICAQYFYCILMLVFLYFVWCL